MKFHDPRPMRSIRNSILCLVLAAFCGSARGEDAQPSTQTIQEISTLSSSQFYTHFALIRTMLEGKWNQKVFEKYSFYDGVNLQMMKRYGEELKDDKKWGPFFDMRNALHLEVYEKLQPLIKKKRGDKDLTDADQKLLDDLDNRIFEKLMK